MKILVRFFRFNPKDKKLYVFEKEQETFEKTDNSGIITFPLDTEFCQIFLFSEEKNKYIYNNTCYVDIQGQFCVKEKIIIVTKHSYLFILHENDYIENTGNIKN